MAKRFASKKQPQDDSFRIIRAALDPQDSSGLPNMLSEVALILDAFGCAIWELVQDDLDDSGGRIFVLADYFPTSHGYARHDLSLAHSSTATAIVEGRSIIMNDIQNDREGVGKNHPFIKRHQINRKMCAPITFVDRKSGSLNVYRKKTDPPFSEGDEKRLRNLVQVVPMAYNAIREKASLKLIGRIDDLLHEIEAKPDVKRFSKSTVKHAIRDICNQVAETFNSLEVSVFLDDRTITDDDCELMGTTWPLKISKTRFARNEAEGLTGYVLGRRKSVRIYDLACFDRDESLIHRKYPGLIWRDSLRIQRTAPRVLGIRDLAEMPPLSIMAAPILAGRQSIGVIRCCGAKRGPYYFTDRDLELLELVAAQISRFWTIWISRRALQDENRFWKQLVSCTAGLNQFVQVKMTEEPFDAPSVYSESASRLQEIFDSAESVTVGPLVQPLPARPPKRRPGTIAKNIRLMNKEVVKLMIEPAEPRGLPKHARTAAELLCSQLTLYTDLAVWIDQARTAQAELKATIRRQTQTFQDLTHQLLGPILMIRRRSEVAVETEGADKKNLYAIRGLCNKARRVTMSLRVLSNLASGNPLPLNMKPLNIHALKRLLIRAAQDSIVMADPERRIGWRLDDAGLDVADLVGVCVDSDLLEQAVSSILDNAVKYSFGDSEILIAGTMTRKGNFQITVQNRGIKIRRHEVTLAKQRGWRSDEARLTTGEGSGIGLWIVENIMRSHNGTLEISPTDAFHETVVKLVFPAK